MLKTKKEIAYVVGIILALIAIVVIIAIGLRKTDENEETDAAGSAEITSTVVSEKHGLVEAEETISFETVQEGLRDMGFLVTEEYYYTEVMTHSKLLKVFGKEVKIPFTESSYVASYDGVIEAGIDFSAITVSIDSKDGKHQVTVMIPKPVIQANDIDPDSFQVYSETTGIANPFSVEEYNQSLKELERDVEKKAIENGILERAEEHAKQLIKGFVGGMLLDQDYTLEIVVK